MLFLSEKHSSVVCRHILSPFSLRFLLLARLVYSTSHGISNCHYYKLCRKFVRTIHNKKIDLIRQIILCCDGEDSEG
jgi:hypothetical protein